MATFTYNNTQPGYWTYASALTVGGEQALLESIVTSITLPLAPDRFANTLVRRVGREAAARYHEALAQLLNHGEKVTTSNHQPGKPRMNADEHR